MEVCIAHCCFLCCHRIERGQRCASKQMWIHVIVAGLIGNVFTSMLLRLKHHSFALSFSQLTLFTNETSHLSIVSRRLLAAALKSQASKPKTSLSVMVCVYILCIYMTYRGAKAKAADYVCVYIYIIIYIYIYIYNYIYIYIIIYIYTHTLMCVYIYIYISKFYAQFFGLELDSRKH